MFLSVEQGTRSPQRNYRTHEGCWLLIERADFNSGGDGYQTRKQGIAPLTFRHQQTAGTGTTLPGGDERRLNHRVDRRIKVFDLIDNQRVITAHFQGQNLVRAPGELLVQQVTGAAGPGEKQTVYPRIGRQRNARFARTLQQVQYTRWQPGLNPALDRQLSDFGCQLAGFEQYGVARQQRRNDMPVRQMPREVVGTKDRNHAVRLMAQHSGGVAQRATFFAGTLTVALHRNSDFIDHAGDFGGRLPERLAGFFTDAMRQFVRMRFQTGGKRFKHRDSLVQRAFGPGWKCLTRSLHGRIDLYSRCALTGPHHVLSDGVQRLKTLALPGLPGTCDIKRTHQTASLAADKGTART